MRPMIAVLVLAAGCDDPLRDCQIEALGDENPAVDVGPMHRADQPCVLCHSPYGGADPDLSIGGTLHRATDDGVLPAPGLYVRVKDSDGRRVVLGPTNCSGNFYASVEQYNPGYPIVVEVVTSPESVDPPLARMEGRIGRDGSCATCHTADASASSAGPVVIASEVDDQNCLPVPAQPLAAMPSCTD